MSAASPAPGAALDRRIALARELDDLISHIRGRPAFRDFLRPPPLEQMLPAARGGPVAVLNVSHWRCDALLVHTSGITVCPLPTLTGHDIAEHTRHYLETLHLKEVRTLADDLADEEARRDPTVPNRMLAQAAARAAHQAAQAAEVMLSDLLEWLWDTVAEPVLTALGYTGTPGARLDEWPRLWWCPTGPLTLLPLHAAGYHADRGLRTVLDRVISSYTPTARALIEARKPIDDSAGIDDRMLVVALANTPGERPLPGADAERALLESRYGAVTGVHGSAATGDRVLRELRRHRWVHLSCHGNQNLREPARGGLILYDRVLSIADIRAERYRGELACLSACKTATGGVVLLDEVITVSAALHYTGYRHVIGTLWSVYDTTASELFGRFYPDITVDGRLRAARSPYALHAAVTRLRDESPATPTVWTPFTHTGP